MNKVVTRFAPSPTGFMHMGGVRTALYSWLYARKHGGTFILRIEDTDKEREVEGSIEHIIESLKWLGLSWDEGIGIGGPHAPYIQSQRLLLYRRYAETLIKKGYAYADPYSESEVEGLRKEAEAQKRPFLYREHRPENPPTWDGSMPLRFKVKELKRYEWNDFVRGTLSAGDEALDDFILIKSDGYPTYNFAHVIDDIEMCVTHVMRGEEFISSTPKFLSLYDALEVERPHYATMPVILAQDGKRKLGKRDGAKDILEYRTEGYLPEAMLNFLALLGWNPGDEREVMSIDELTEAFDLSRVHKAGAAFNEQKLLWMNFEHLKRLSDEEYLARIRDYAQAQKRELPPYIALTIPVLRDRAQTLSEALELAVSECSFLEASVAYEPELLVRGAKADAAAVSAHLAHVKNELEGLGEGDWNAAAIKELLFPYADAQGRSAVLWPMRVALSGKERSPDPFTLAGLIGKQRTLNRLEQAVLKTRN